jgi:hypothetical protein
MDQLPNRGIRMDGYNIYPDPALRGKTPWPVIASSMWLRLGFVAVCAVVVALTELYKGDANPLAAVAWIFGGAWVAALSWRRAKVLLDRMDGVNAASAAGTSETVASRSSTQPSWDRRDAGTPQVRG